MPVAVQKTDVKTRQKMFQLDDGLRVHEKGGTKDKVKDKYYIIIPN